MKYSITAVLAAAGLAFAANGASAQINPQTNVSVDLVMNAFQSVPVFNCTATVPGTVNNNTVTVATTGVTFSGSGACPAVTMTSDIVIDYFPTSSTTANIDITNINTTSVLGTCNQVAPISGTATLSTGSASGVIAGTPSSCTFAVDYAVTPAFISF